MKNAGQTVAAMLVLAGLGTGLLGWRVVGLARAQDDLAPGPDAAVVAQNCTTCHASNVFTSLRMGAAQWSSVIDEMVGEGATLSDADREKVIAYLAANYGEVAHATAAPAAQPSATPAPAAPVPATPAPAQ